MAELSGGFAGVGPMSAEQVADAILYAVSRPPEVSISEVLLRPSNQPM